MKVYFLGILDKILPIYSTIVYDASSRLKEFVLTKEPSRFMQMRFVTDPLHKEIHTSCMESFRSTFYIIR